MQTLRLFTPGPAPVLPAALSVFSQPIMHHRTPDFMAVLEEVRAGLKELFGTRQEVLVLSSSGTGAMEGVVTNLFSPCDQVIVVRGGKFGERWGNIATAYGLEVIPIDIPWGCAPEVRQIEVGLKTHPKAKAVLMQACETSTGVDYPVEQIAALTRSIRPEGPQALLVVDAISYLGVSPYEMDRWGVDVTVSGSQKGLMLPPGLSFASLNDRAWEQHKRGGLPRYYFDFSKERKAIVNNQTAYTPAVSLILGLREVLRYFEREGKDAVFSRYHTFSSAMRAAVGALRLELFSKSHSNGLVSICLPHPLNSKAIVKMLRDKYQMMIARGQGEYSDNVIRISCIGHTEASDLISVFSALEEVLKAQGASIEIGKGVACLEAALLGNKA